MREARKRGALQTLSRQQLKLHRAVLSIVPENVEMWALAWLRFGDTDVRTSVRVMRWTSDAIGVEVQVGAERLRCWVWQGAVEHLASRADAWR